MYYETRNLLDLRVGNSHSIKVLFHLRKIDLKWFNENSDGCIKQLVQLVSKKILPVECKEEIEKYHGLRFGGTITSSNNDGSKKKDRIGKSSGTTKRKRNSSDDKKKDRHDKKNKRLNGNSGKNKDKKITSKGKGNTSAEKNRERNSPKKQNQNETDIDDSKLSSSYFKPEITFLYAENIQIHEHKYSQIYW